MPRHDRLARAALVVLIVLQGVMLAALFAGTPPHPPQAIPLFAIAPFLGVALAFAGAALMLEPTGTVEGRICSAAAALCALLSYGPQKFLDAQFTLIWPAVVMGLGAALLLLWALYAGWRARSMGSRGGGTRAQARIRSDFGS